MFHTTGENEGKRLDYGWRRRINEILPGDRIRVSGETTDMFDSSWNPIYASHPDSAQLDFQFPLRVGAAWSYASPMGAMTSDGRNYDFRGHMKVVAYETITVPAGTFKCFRIEGGYDWVVTFPSGNADWRADSQLSITNWHCSEIRYLGIVRTAKSR